LLRPKQYPLDMRMSDLLDGMTEYGKEIRRQTLLAWAAGYIDGEGCINISCTVNQKTGRRSHSLKLTVSSCEIDSIKRLGAIFEIGSFRKQWRYGNRRDIYTWTVSQQEAGAVLSVICEHLTIKQWQAYIAFAFLRTGPITKHNRAEVEDRRDRMMLEMSKAKNRIYVPDDRDEEDWEDSPEYLEQAQ